MLKKKPWNYDLRLVFCLRIVSRRESDNRKKAFRSSRHCISSVKKTKLDYYTSQCTTIKPSIKYYLNTLYEMCTYYMYAVWEFKNCTKTFFDHALSLAHIVHWMHNNQIFWVILQNSLLTHYIITSCIHLDVLEWKIKKKLKDAICFFVHTWNRTAITCRVVDWPPKMCTGANALRLY